MIIIRFLFPQVSCPPAPIKGGRGAKKRTEGGRTGYGNKKRAEFVKSSPSLKVSNLKLLQQFLVISLEWLPINKVEKGEAADIIEEAPVIL